MSARHDRTTRRPFLRRSTTERTSANDVLADERRARLRRTAGRAGAAAVAVALTAALLGPLGPGGEPAEVVGDDTALAAASTNPVTPGAFTGYGFDQCETQSQAKMDAWLAHSPYRAVGVYISGNSRFCKTQKLLTPTWVSTQLAKGWKILAITLGPQSTCVGRFPRYGANIDPTISNQKAGGYATARTQGSAEADSAIAAAQGLGIVPGSTIWYDLEGWSNYKDATCRESSLAFLSGWTTRIRQLGYVSGVYSSAGSGMRILDDARVQGRGDVVLPDQIWIARWDNIANTSTSYIREDGWRPGARMKQYRGGHDETHGGVTINIDSNYIELGPATPMAESHCGGVDIDVKYRSLAPLTSGKVSKPQHVVALQCLLAERGMYAKKLHGRYSKPVLKATQRWQRAAGRRVTNGWSKGDWMSLHARGSRPRLMIGATGPDVRRLQRALKAALPASSGVVATGVFTAETGQQVKAYKARVGLGKGKKATPAVWRSLSAGRR